MKAVLSPKAGPPEVLQYTEIDKPHPKANEILIKVRRATVTIGDVKMRKFSRLVLAIVGLVFGFKPMKIPGIEYAGDVEATGDRVTGFSTGDPVCGTTTGLTFGANAEFVCVPQISRLCVIAIKPESISYADSAAATVGGMTALQLLKRAKLQSGESVLIYGASGSVGSFAVQLAKHFGAVVSAVSSTTNLPLVKSIGADHTIDYTTTDFTQNGQTYDVIFDAVGKTSKSKCEKSLGLSGRFISVKNSTKEKGDELEYIQNLVVSGDIKVVIDREYSLAQIVEAHRYVESGRKKGNVVIEVSEK